MAEQSAAIEAAHPPELMLKVINPILRQALRSPLGSRITEFMLVRFTGRKSGRQFAVPVSAHHLDGKLYVVLEAQWKYNFRDGADAQVSHGGKTTAMRGVLITDKPTVADITHRLAQSYGAKRAQRTMGLKFRDDRLPSAADWTEAVERLKIAAIHLSPR